MSDPSPTMRPVQEYVPSRYQRDRELFEAYWSWHIDRYGSEPSSQQSLLCCDWALHLMELWVKESNGSSAINGVS